MTSNRSKAYLIRARCWRWIAVGAVSLSGWACTRAPEPPKEERRSVSAETEIIQPKTVRDHFTAPGTVQARTRTVLSSKLSGQIASVHVREGDQVDQGQLLIEIEGLDVTAQLHRAEAGSEEARRALEEADSAIRAGEAGLHAAEANRDLAFATRKRYELLRDRRSVSPQEFDEVDARYKAAASDAERARELLRAAQARRAAALAGIDRTTAEVESARAAAGYLRIASPISGVVTARNAEPGMLATPGTPLLSLDDDSAYQLEALVDESRVSGIRTGQHVPVEIDATGSSLDGVVAEVAPASDPEARTYTVKLDLVLNPSLRRRMRSGFFGRALFPAGERQALLIPESALVHRGELTGVYAIQDGLALFRLIRAGKSYEQGVEILSGLRPGDEIVRSPKPEIADGVRILGSASPDDESGGAP